MYKLPFPVGTTYTCTQGNNGSVSHSGKAKYAFDFSMSIGTPITASRSGTVHMVVENWANWNCPYISGSGCNNSCINDVNRIVINHGDGTYALYLHLTQNGSSVSVGQYINQGEVIGYSGNSGCSTNPHLHFMVMNSGSSYYEQSIPISFCDVSTNNGVPTSSNSYLSQNCTTCPQTPNTTYPANNSTVSTPIIFDWNDVSSTAQYRIQVSTSSTGWSATDGFTNATTESSSIRVNQNTSNNSLYNWSSTSPYPPQPNTTYYYTVKNFDCGQNSSYSPVKSFTTSCTGAIPTPISPSNGQTNVSTPVLLDWNDVGNNPEYRVQVSTSNSGWTAANGFTSSTSESSTIRVNQNTNDISSFNWGSTSLYPPQSGTTYYWTVKAYSCFQNSDYSPVRSFTVGSSSGCNPPTTTLTSPSSGTNYNLGQNINLQWTGNGNGCTIQDYLIELTAPNGSATSPTQTTNNFSFTAPSNGLGTWYWRVRTRNANGVWGAYTSSRSFTISQSTTNYTISVSANPSVGGSVTGGGSFSNGSGCSVVATPNTGYNFTNWTENGVVVSTNPNYVFTISGNRNLVANFTNALSTVDVEKQKSEVSPNPFTNFLKIKSDKNDVKSIEIFDTSGKLIVNKRFQKGVKEFNLDTAEILQGIYILKINKLEHSETHKIIKK